MEQYHVGYVPTKKKKSRMTKKIDLEKIFVSALGSKEKLQWYLQYEINVVDYLDQTKTSFMAFLDITMALIPRGKKLELIGDLSAVRILSLLRKDRPELHEILIKDPNGRTWMDNQIRLFKERFL